MPGAGESQGHFVNPLDRQGAGVENLFDAVKAHHSSLKDLVLFLDVFDHFFLAAVERRSFDGKLKGLGVGIIGEPDLENQFIVCPKGLQPVGDVPDLSF